VQLPLGRCPPIATSGKYRQVDAPSLAGSVPVVVDSAAGPRVLAFLPGAVTELAWNGTTLAPVAGAKLPPAPAGAVTAFAAADLDGDGGPDLVVGQTGGAGTLVYLNQSGVLTSSPGALPPIILDIVGVAAIDVDGDGDRDVVLAHAGGVKLLLNRGNALLEDG